MEVQTRSFASETDVPAAWYETPVVRDYGLYIVAGAGLLLLGIIVAFFLWRRRTVLAAAATATAQAATAVLSRNGTPGAPSLFAEGTANKAAVEAMIDGGELLRPAAARDYSGKLDIARTLVTGDRDRAMAVARQMLLADLTAPAAAAAKAAPAAAATDDEDDA